MAKPKPPRTDPDKLDDFLDRFDEGPDDLSLLMQLGRLGRLQKKGELSNAAISFELLHIIFERLKEGGASPDCWNRLVRADTPAITIPLRYIKPLADGWKRYTSEEKGLSLADALRLGKPGAGTRLAATVMKHRRDFAAAFKIEAVRAFLADRGEEKSIETIIAEFAETSGVSPRRLKRAYDDAIEDVRAVSEFLGYPITRPS